MNDERLLHLSEEQWSQIEGIFPQRRGESGFEAKISNGLVFEAALFGERTGCPWRDLPTAYTGMTTPSTKDVAWRERS